MTIKVGDKMPSGTFREMGKDGPVEVDAEGFFKGRKVVIFGLPGAYTPTCHRNHLPGFLQHLETIKSRGVAEVAVISANDVFVMGAWASDTGGEGKIRYFADGTAVYTKALGLDMDMGAAMGVRSKRYSMIIDDGVVKSLNIEEAPGKAEASGAAAILDQLS